MWLLTALANAQLPLATGEDAEVSEDGLHRLDRSEIVGAWVKPDLDLSGNSKIFFMPSVVTFRDLDSGQSNQFTAGTDEIFPVATAQQDSMRSQFAEDLHDALDDSDVFELTDQLGRDVLLVRGSLLDIISAVPPDVSGSRVVGSIRWAYAATVMIELRDAMSDEVLARTVERQRADGPIEVSEVSVLTPRLLDNWARRLARNVDSLAELSR
jgi:hypothetical protein